MINNKAKVLIRYILGNLINPEAEAVENIYLGDKINWMLYLETGTPPDWKFECQLAFDFKIHQGVYTNISSTDCSHQKRSPFIFLNFFY
jgi:hypothetical protein